MGLYVVDHRTDVCVGDSPVTVCISVLNGHELSAYEGERLHMRVDTRRIRGVTRHGAGVVFLADERLVALTSTELDWYHHVLCSSSSDWRDLTPAVLSGVQNEHEGSYVTKVSGMVVSVVEKAFRESCVARGRQGQRWARVRVLLRFTETTGTCVQTRLPPAYLESLKGSDFPVTHVFRVPRFGKGKQALPALREALARLLVEHEAKVSLFEPGELLDYIQAEGECPGARATVAFPYMVEQGIEWNGSEVRSVSTDGHAWSCGVQAGWKLTFMKCEDEIQMTFDKGHPAWPVEAGDCLLIDITGNWEKNTESDTPLGKAADELRSFIRAGVKHCNTEIYRFERSSRIRSSAGHKGDCFKFDVRFRSFQKTRKCPAGRTTVDERTAAMQLVADDLQFESEGFVLHISVKCNWLVMKLVNRLTPTHDLIDQAASRCLPVILKAAYDQCRVASEGEHRSAELAVQVSSEVALPKSTWDAFQKKEKASVLKLVATKVQSSLQSDILKGFSVRATRNGLAADLSIEWQHQDGKLLEFPEEITHVLPAAAESSELEDENESSKCPVRYFSFLEISLFEPNLFFWADMLGGLQACADGRGQLPPCDVLGLCTEDREMCNMPG